MSTIGTVGVCGTGAMGGGIAQVATAGHPALVFDTAVAALAAGDARLTSGLQSLIKRGRMSDGEADQIAGRVEWVAELEALALCDLVIGQSWRMSASSGRSSRHWRLSCPRTRSLPQTRPRSLSQASPGS